ncbi:MAG: oligosaccharide flippase family protein [Desulfuromonadales bacterium]
MNIIQNGGIKLSCKIATGVMQLVMLPIIIKYVTIEGFGVWETILAVTQIFTFIQNVVSGTMLWKLPRYYVENKYVTIALTVRYGIFFYLICFIFIWPLIYVFSDNILLMLNIKQEYLKSSSIIFPIVFLFIIINAVNDLFAAVINSSQQSGVTYSIQTVAYFINYSVTIYSFSRDCGIFSLLYGIMVGYTFNFLIFLYYSKKLCKTISILPAVPKRSEINAVLKYTVNLSIGSLSSFLRSQSDKIVLAFFASSVWVGYYGIANRLASQLMEISGLFYISIITNISAHKSSNSNIVIHNLFTKMSMLLTVSVGFATALLAGCYQEILSLWIKRVDNEVVIILLLLVLGNYVAIALTGAGTAICKGLGKIEIETNYLVLNLFINIILTIILVSSVGSLGTVIASTLSWIISSVYFAYKFNVFMKFKAEIDVLIIIIISLMTPLITQFIKYKLIFYSADVPQIQLLLYTATLTLSIYISLVFISRIFLIRKTATIL